MRFERLTQPTTEPLSATEAQLWIPGADSSWLTAAIPLVRDWLEQELQRPLAPSDWRCWYDRSEIEGRALHLPIAPAAALVSLTAYDVDGTATALSTTGCTVWGSTLSLSEATYNQLTALDLRATDALAVVVTAGHGHAQTTPAPSAILIGMREALAYWHMHRGEGFSLIRSVPQDVGAGGGYTTSPPVPQWILRRLVGYYHR